MGSCVLWCDDELLVGRENRLWWDAFYQPRRCAASSCGRERIVPAGPHTASPTFCTSRIRDNTPLEQLPDILLHCQRRGCGQVALGHQPIPRDCEFLEIPF